MYGEPNSMKAGTAFLVDFLEMLEVTTERARELSVDTFVSRCPPVKLVGETGELSAVESVPSERVSIRARCGKSGVSGVVLSERERVDSEQVSARRVQASGISFVSTGAEMLRAGGGVRRSLERTPEGYE